MTATRTTLLALASRVEAATSGCRKLDAEICSRLFGRSIGVSRYTFNIDAALSLYITIPERIPSNPRLATAEALRQRAIAKEPEA